MMPEQKKYLTNYMSVLPTYRNQSTDFFANQLTGFYMRTTPAFNGSVLSSKGNQSIDLQNTAHISLISIEYKYKKSWANDSKEKVIVKKSDHLKRYTF